MIKEINNKLSRIPMYKLILYYLIFLFIIALILGVFNLVPVNPIPLLLSTLIITVTCVIVNKLFSNIFEAPTRFESVYITSLILTLIISPDLTFKGILFIVGVSAIAMASKYILSFNKKNIFNPAAFAVTITGLTIGYSATWWVGTMYMAPFIILGGIILVKNIRMINIVALFFLSTLLLTLIYGIINALDLVKILTQAILYSPILFLGFVMLTDPFTMPFKKDFKNIFGIIVGILVSPFAVIGGFYFTPEAALVFGNIFAFITKLPKKAPEIQKPIKPEESIQNQPTQAN